MNSLIETYDNHLKKLASVPAARRMSLTYRVIFPWALLPFAAVLLVSFLGLPRDFGAWFILPATCIAATGTMFAALRVAKHGSQYDRERTDT